MTRQRKDKRKDERGAILVVSVVGIVLSMIAGGLAIDLGFVAHEARRNQKIADLAALDGARALATGGAVTAATDSAMRNGLTTAPASLDVKCASTAAGPFVACASGHSVIKVAVTSQHDSLFPFVGDSGNITRDAVSSIKGLAGFSLGSGVANVNTKKSILDSMLGQMIGASANLNIANYQGLANGVLTLDAIRDELVLMGLSVGTAEQFMDTDITLAQLYAATGNALVRNGDTANAAVFCASSVVGQPSACTGTSLAARANVNHTVRFRRLFNVATGYEDAAMSSRINLFQLLTGSAAVANGTNAVSVPAINLGVPLVANATGSLTLIESPRQYFGPAGAITGTPHVTTSQVDLTVTANLLNILGGSVGSVSVRVVGGQAKGWLTEANCVVSPKRTTVHGATQAASVTATATVGGLPVPIGATTTGNSADLTFSYPLHPAPSSPAQQSVPTGASSLNLSSGNVLVNSAVSAIDSVVIQPLLDALGLSVGTADVLGLDPLTCTLPALLS